MPSDSEDPTVTIRKMAEEDVGPAMELLDHWDMAPETDRDDGERTRIRVPNSFVAEDTGSVVGVSSYILHTDTLGETASLAVDPEYRGQGIGYRLQVARLREMRSRGIETVRTETDRPETIEWYVEKLGYERIGTTPKKHDFSLPEVDEWTILELDLRKWIESGA